MTGVSTLQKRRVRPLIHRKMHGGAYRRERESLKICFVRPFFWLSVERIRDDDMAGKTPFFHIIYPPHPIPNLILH